MDLIPPRSVVEIGKIMAEGDTVHPGTEWQDREWTDHLNHALVHAFKLLEGDTSEDHMGHFACRAMMAHETYLQQSARKE